jgi:molybdopterin-dependent oxidoreductase alpha subunit
VSHRLEKTWAQRLARLVPFGLGQVKPPHFRDMLRVVWQNRDNLPYAWKVLTRGVCDGCALGVAGLHDWTIDGVHLCMTRLTLLRLNTMPALDVRRLADVDALRHLRNDQLRELGRLPVPLLRERGDRGFRRINWDEAYARIAERIRASGPRRIAFYLTARAITNETYYVAQKVARFFGTNNIDNAARLCHSPSTGAMKRALGVAATTCSYRDWWGTDLIVFFGANPANDQPVTMKYLHEAKRLGTKVVMVNPYREPGMERYWVPSTARSALFGTDIADYWFGVAQGGDIAFLYGAIKVLLESGGYDQTFVGAHTDGLDELAAAAAAVQWPDLERQAGLPRASMEEFAGLVRDARTGVLVWSMGITQHAFGGQTVQMIVNLGLLKGWIGRDRCGLMPIRGHSGVQGGAEMGAYATALPGGRPITPESARELSQAYGFPVPAEPGLTSTEMVEAAAREQLDLLYCLGGNFLHTLPDPAYVAAAMARVPLRVHQDIIVTDQMLLDPGEEVILLPAKTRYEQEGGGTQTSTERRVMFSPELPRQVGEAKAEWRILRELAAAVDPQRAERLGCRAAPPSAPRSPASCVSTTAFSSSSAAANPSSTAARTCPPARRFRPPTAGPICMPCRCRRASARRARSRSAPGAASSSTRSSTPTPTRSPARGATRCSCIPTTPPRCTSPATIASRWSTSTAASKGACASRRSRAATCRCTGPSRTRSSPAASSTRSAVRPTTTPSSASNASEPPLLEGGAPSPAGRGWPVECGGLPPLWRGWGDWV